MDGEDELVGRYFVAGGVSITGGDANTVTEPTTSSVIQIDFNSGSNRGKSMTLTPIQGAVGQIASWICAPTSNNGIDRKRLPKSCQ